MRRILLATTALVVLSAAASPAFAFNTLNVFELGSNGGQSGQLDFGGGNSLTGAQIGAGNYIDNGYCNFGCLALSDPGQANGLGLNSAVVVQLGVANTMKNRQKTVLGVNSNITVQAGLGNGANNAQQSQAGVNSSIIGQLGFFNSASNNQTSGVPLTSKTGGGKTNSSVQLQAGIGNGSSVTQDVANGSTKGDNNSTTVQIGGGNASQVSQKGGNDQLTGQLGAGNVSITDQTHTNGTINDSTTLQAGLGNVSVTGQNGANNDATTVQGGIANVSVTSQNDKNNTSQTFQGGVGNVAVVSQSGNGTNWSAVGQVGAGNTFTSTQVSY